MSHSASDRTVFPVFVAATLAVGMSTGMEAQESDSLSAVERGAANLIATETSMWADEAELFLELRDGTTTRLTLRDGEVAVDGRTVGTYESGGELDESWRQLLREATGPHGEVAASLIEWDSPTEGAGETLDSTLEALLLQDPGSLPDDAADAVAPTMPGVGDTINRLENRIRELQDRLRNMEDDVESRVRSDVRRDRRGSGSWSMFRHIRNGIAGILSTIFTYIVLVGLGFAAVFFGQKYIEGVADTARHVTLRSLGVGFAGSFLAIPAFVTGILMLVISIVGIPALLVWVPLFPVAVFVAALFGYLAVAHAAGESLAERRFYGGEWFKRANSYYYILTGVGLLLALFLAGHVVGMAGPLLGFLKGLIVFMAVVLTWAAITVGFGAVLLSRGGTRPVRPASAPVEPDLEGDIDA